MPNPAEHPVTKWALAGAIVISLIISVIWFRFRLGRMAVHLLADLWRRRPAVIVAAGLVPVSVIFWVGAALDSSSDHSWYIWAMLPGFLAALTCWSSMLLSNFRKH